MIIPHQMLSPEALQGVIEAFVTREGTDYGIQDVSLATKILQVRQQLDAGTAVLVYDEDTESCTIQPTNQLSDDLRQSGSCWLTYSESTPCAMKAFPHKRLCDFPISSSDSKTCLKRYKIKTNLVSVGRP